MIPNVNEKKTNDLTVVAVCKKDDELRTKRGGRGSIHGYSVEDVKKGETERERDNKLGNAVGWSKRDREISRKEKYNDRWKKRKTKLKK